MHFELGGVVTFVIGAVVGAVLALGALLLSLLRIHDKVLQKEKRSEDKAIAEARLTASQAEQILQAALPRLHNNSDNEAQSAALPKPTAVRERTSDSVAAHEPSDAEAYADVDLESIEDNWQTLMRVSKDRQRDIRNFGAFLQEFVQTNQHFAKGCQKLSKHADAMFQSSEDAMIRRWSTALSVAAAQLSTHTEALGTALAAEIEQRLTKMADEHAMLEKTLGQEATRLMKEFRDALNEHQQAEATRDRMAHKLEQAAEKSKEAVQSKHIKRLQVAEADAQETSKTLAHFKHVFLTKMPRVQKDFKLMMRNEQAVLQNVLLRFSELMLQSKGRRTEVYSRLQVDLGSSNLSTGSAYDAMMESALNQATQRSRRSQETPKLDMASEAAAALASSLPSSMPPFPETLKDAVQPETAVWFNAFLGRFYRDIARSEVFRQWLLTKLHFLLNKGKLPEYVDELQVSDLKFGASPPLLRNLRWVPVREADGQDTEYDVVFTADVLFRGGLGFSVNTKLWVNWPRDRYAFLPVRVELELSELLGTIRFGVSKHNTFVGFVEEPFTKFAVQSSVGNNLKFENLPKVSNIIVNRIKRAIRNRLVQPKAHRFRLFWPQKWWPDVTSETLAAAAAQKNAAATTQAPATTTEQQAAAASAAGVSAEHTAGDSSVGADATTVNAGTDSQQHTTTTEPPQIVDPAEYAAMHGRAGAKDSPESTPATTPAHGGGQRRGSEEMHDHATARQFIGRMLFKKTTPRAGASGSGDAADETTAAASQSSQEPSDRRSRRRATNMAASIGNKLRAIATNRPPVHMNSWLRPRRNSDLSQVDGRDSMIDDFTPVDMEAEFDEDEDDVDVEGVLHPAEAERADDSESEDEAEAEEMRARWAQLLEAAHQHVESNQEGLEFAPVPRTLFRHGSMDSDTRPRVVSTDFRPMQRSTSTDTEIFEDVRRKRRSRSLSDFRTIALLAATDETKDDVSHPGEKARRKKAGTDDFQVGLRSKPRSPALNHHRSASDGAFAKESLFIPSQPLIPIRISRKGARQVPLPFDPTATGASIMKGSLKAMKPRMTATLALARWRWVVIEAGVLKIYENEGDLIPKSTYALRGATCRPLATNAAFEITFAGPEAVQHHQPDEHSVPELSPRASSSDNPITKAVRLICQAESEALSRAWIVAIQTSAKT